MDPFTAQLQKHGNFALMVHRILTVFCLFFLQILTQHTFTKTQFVVFPEIKYKWRGKKALPVKSPKKVDGWFP